MLHHLGVAVFEGRLVACWVHGLLEGADLAGSCGGMMGRGRANKV